MAIDKIQIDLIEYKGNKIKKEVTCSKANTESFKKDFFKEMDKDFTNVQLTTNASPQMESAKVELKVI